MKTPNCELCAWLKLLKMRDNQMIPMGGGWFCSAQGYKLAFEIYGNKNCQKLYEEKPIIAITPPKQPPEKP